MQMVKIFKKITIPSDYFNSFYHHITHDLLFYLFDNLQNENYNLLRDLEEALTTNANGEYI
jgi:hypothetical protein